MRIAVIGAGISGLVSAYVLAKEGVDVALYEKQDYLGGHARTVTFEGVDLDLGFMVFNRVTYPNMMEFFESLGVDMETSDMSFSVSLDKGKGCEWGSRNGFSGLFSQKRNIVNPYFWQVIREIIKFKEDVIQYIEHLESNPDIDRNETLGHFIKSKGYSQLFQKAYLLFGRPQWLTVRWRSQSYIDKVTEELDRRGCQIKTGYAVNSVSTFDGGCTVTCLDGSSESYDACIMGVHAPDALSMLGEEVTYEEKRILGAFQYASSDIFLHHDKNLMPRNQAAWSSWNFLGNTGNRICLTYWLNVLQNLDETGEPFFVTLNPPHTPDNTLLKWTTSHPIPSVAASKASLELDQIQGNRGIWFCGAYQGYGFHEDGLKAGMIAAHSVLGRNCNLLTNKKHMVPSLTETGARLFVTRFLVYGVGRKLSPCLFKSFTLLSAKLHFVNHSLLEDGGTVYTFEGTKGKCHLKSVLRVHNPQFYWKIATQADLGLADAYINGDFSFVDKEEGLLDLFMIFIANRDMNNSVNTSKRGWWTPMFFTAGIASAKYFIRHVSRQNTLTQARRNISRHYDLAKVESKHEVLEIGCGWGTLAIELVRRTGCKYTGITLSEEQLKYAEIKVKEAGLQDRIRFLLCDYRQVPDTIKYDRIISWYVLLIATAFQVGPMCDTKILSKLEIIALGFDEKFIRTWEYYFIYCAAGFKTRTLGVYQIVFSRPGNLSAFKDPYKSIPSDF
ncbi:hypothetical protein C5167_023831 [Papaver somniferum]|uniref:Amine oxidase domain-containing protein n=1 Tax=Papaver somniferum TaxID=3469 RepID=A0A4Y7JLV8_PAPSO|nr:hypothetical protein C5167_023831 [Papaver somniferum]